MYKLLVLKRNTWNRMSWSYHSVVAKVPVFGPEVNEFELYVRYYVHFRTNTHGERYEASDSTVMGQIESLLFF